jgi:geranylgeranyl pyrophosphate synthase
MGDFFKRLTTPYRKELEQVDQRIASALTHVSDSTAAGHMRYFMGSRGHMLRPLIAIISYGYVKGTSLGALDLPERTRLHTLGAALELLHTASLVHDDVIDGSDARRGQPSLNKKLGNTEAVLVGNLFYLSAFRLITELEDPWFLQTFISTAEAMCLGEVLQNETAGNPIDSDEYLRIIERKTGRLIACSAGTAARLAGASEPLTQQMFSLAGQMGIMYQLKDDAQDHDVSNVRAEDVLELHSAWRNLLQETSGNISDATVHGKALKNLIQYFLQGNQ